MTVYAHTIKSGTGSRKLNIKRVGRGNSSQKGTYSGRGGKGQTARSGGGSRSHMRAWRTLLLRMPKNRGFKSLNPKAETVTLSTVNRLFVAGETVTPELLKKRGAIGTVQNGVKIVASGKIEHALQFTGCVASKTAKDLIEKAGGKI